MMLLLPLLLLLLGVQTSLQQQATPPPGRCDVEQRMEVHSVCTSCAAVGASVCPQGFSSVGITNCSYVVTVGVSMALDGCQHICVKRFNQPQCCPEYWGPLCLPCPRWSGKSCNFHGTCLDGDLGNGSCVCDAGFAGFACQECADPSAYGEKCDQKCDCANGLCNKGPEGDGECYCQPPYSGRKCDQVSSRCSSCVPYSYCKGEGASSGCECLPGHKRAPSGKCASVCSQRDCDPNAQCSSQGSKVTCACKPDYQGDGRVCLPRNPCAQNNGGCPINSTLCVFKGPNKSSCECMSGLSPVGGAAPEFGCELVSACSADTCDASAICQTQMDGRPSCLCFPGKLSDGRRCYGNLMERIIELGRSGSWRENLTEAVGLFERSCSMMLSSGGPFTVLLPLMKTSLKVSDEEQACRGHVILGQHLSKDLLGRDLSLYGGAMLRGKGNKQFILMADPRRLYTIVQDDFPAANGIIHIIDKPITDQAKSPLDLQFADKTIAEILRTDGRFNRFLSLADNCGAPPPLQGPGPLTVFIPTNEAVDRARDGSILYMLNHAQHKLQTLLRNHIYSQAVLTVDELSSLKRLQTTANQVLTVSVSTDGRVELGEKRVHLVHSDLMASNGIIHMIDGLLYPSSILPVLPHRCDVIDSMIIMAKCVDCTLLSRTECRDGEELPGSSVCYYLPSPLATVQVKGCAKNCNASRTRAECCKGFYGPDCKPCLGGFQHPCYDKGVCSDGITGDGSCSCQSNFMGVACHYCSDPNKHGDNCDEDCTCVHGECDNRPGSSGVCRSGSCADGFSGSNCDRTVTQCNSDGLMEHCHIHAYCSQTGLHTECLCKDGYEGDGHSCTLVNRCLTSDRGDCDMNAECVYLSPGKVSCVCMKGWTGDGQVCVEINNCQLPSRGGCSADADCQHVGPATSECVCKSGFMGDGVVCTFINPCLVNNGGCHETATCLLLKSRNHTCTCPNGFAGDGTICVGSLVEELYLNRFTLGFYSLVQNYIDLNQDLSGNVTLFAPSNQVMLNMTSDDRSFWSNRHHLPHFLWAHTVPGIYSREDLETLVGKKLQTLNPSTSWEISSSNGVMQIGNAAIVSHNLPAKNSYIHIINQTLAPPRSHFPPAPPPLTAFLNSSSNFTLFTKYLLMYKLTENPWYSEFFTLFLPTDDAVRQHLSRTNSSHLDESTVSYHLIPWTILFPDHLFDGMLKSTLLGGENQLQFHVNDKNQTAVNDVLLDGTFTETQNGIVYVLPQVLAIRRNRCSQKIRVPLYGICTDCQEAPRCPFQATPLRTQFPPTMHSNCYYERRVGSKRMRMPGCNIKCHLTTLDHTCCPGFFGAECYKCPGAVGSVCSNQGQCQDGNRGNGECRCYEGFHGTACEDCEPGRYGANCSSKCSCDHGKCVDGLTGSGKCLCYKGWKGVSCSVEIKDDACGGVCDDNANCVTGPGGDALCQCVAGYEGNGTDCKEEDLCSRSNGGCSTFAACTKISAGERSCTCAGGYTGDGVVCLEMDGCLVNNGGCHRSADCIRAGPNITSCQCKLGFRGSGRFCFPVNPCKTDNGGCSRSAKCEYFGNGTRVCKCARDEVGDGYGCRGTTRTELSRWPQNRMFMLMMTSMSLLNRGKFTVFVPVEDNITVSAIDEWQLKGRLSDLARYHTISCERLLLNDLKTTGRAVTSSGRALHFSVRQGYVVINNSSRIVQSNYVTTDGVIHHVDALLTPYQLQEAPLRADPKTMNFTSAAVFYGYSRFIKLVEDAGLLPVLQMKVHRPFTMLWPTDAALGALPAEQQRLLSSPDYQPQLAAIVKAHILRATKVTYIYQETRFASQFTTMYGTTIKFTCDKTSVGDLVVNDNEAKLVERDLLFKDGLAYGISHLLEVPGIGARCNILMNRTSMGRCGLCSSPPRCPFSRRPTGKVESCARRRRKERDGCRNVCQYEAWVERCCPNHYGRNCHVCPGGLDAPCSNHGVCADGREGEGTCKCSAGFRGVACELCDWGFFGSNCTACLCGPKGRCDEGIDGSGECTCVPGWGDERCQTDLSFVPEECRRCHAQADCRPGDGCRCKHGFEGNGTFCDPVPPSDLCANYNGGCHQSADCNQTGPLVNCTCRADYKGDGYFCQPIDRCVEEVNGGCSDFATCSFTGPNQRSCECLPGFVGNGVQCLETVVPPVDRCLEGNGGCDPVASCKDLHFHASTAGVFHLRAPEGKYKMNYSRAAAACREEGGALANFKQMGDAQQLGMHLCVAGWMEGGRVGYPIRFPSLKCGDKHVGVVLYKDPVEQSSEYDAYCFRLRDVSCTCPSDYVGDGDFCNGVLSNVLATNSNFSIFYNSLLDYGASSSDGKQLLELLSHRKSKVTLFVPDDGGFSEHQTLSGRDLENHILSDQRARLFTELKQQEVIKSRLGLQLTVTYGNNESSKLVNERRLLDWDLPAVNGIVHVIEAPLFAPVPEISPHASKGRATSSGAMSAILVTLLLVCVMAVIGYYVFKHKADAFRFHYFKDEDEDGAESSRNKPALVSFPNPLFSGSRAFAEPFGDSGPGAETAEPEEPPQLLDLDQ